MALQDALGIDGKTYSGQEFRLMVAAMSGGRGGVSAAADMAATPNGTPDAKVQIAAGTAIIPATSGALGSYEVPNDAGGLQSPSFTATGANGRWDKLLLQIVAGVPTLVIVAGTPAGFPAYPSLVGQTDYIEICGVKMPANKSVIDNGSNGVIDDRRGVWRMYSIVTSATRPAVPFDGQMIEETDTEKVLIWDDGNSQWAPSRLWMSTAATFPAAPKAGTLAYATDAVLPAGSVVPEATSRAPTPGLYEYAGATSKYNPPWNMPWGVMGYKEITANVSGISTEADITGLSVAFAAIAARRLRVTLHFRSMFSSASDSGVTISLTNAANTHLNEHKDFIFGSGEGASGVDLVHIATSTAATLTFKARAQRTFGTGNLTIEAAATYPAFVLVEDIGPNGQPS